MHFKVKVTCKCGCRYELASGKQSQEKKIACPNCGAEIPEKILPDLMSGLEYLGKIPDVYPSNDAVFSSEGAYQFEIVLPEPSF